MTTEKNILTEDTILADTALVEEIQNAESTGTVWSMDDYLARIKDRW